MITRPSDDLQPIYNEPVRQYRGDLVPELRRVVVHELGWAVRARLDLERRTLVCGVDTDRASLEFTSAHAAVVVLMLRESHSPSAARFRSQAAIWAGAYAVGEAIPVLREIALRDDDDSQTRLNAIKSYVELAGDESLDVLKKLFRSADAMVRVAAYRAALQEGHGKRAEFALESFRAEKSRQVKAMVLRRVSLLQQLDSTVEAKR